MSQDQLWYKDAIIYQVHVRTFFDSNADGIGDFRGLAQKLDYLQELGVNAVWLMPFFPSPLRDDGYDIADYFTVHPSYGTLEDFKTFLQAAHERGIRVIVEMVLNHTSDQHPVVSGVAQVTRQPQARLVCVERHRHQVSRRAHHFRGYRIIQLGVGPGFEGVLLAPVFQSSARSELRQSGRPRRDVESDEVLAGDGRRWFPAGRCALPGRARRHICENLPETHAVLKDLRAKLDQNYPGKMLLAEANQWPADLRAYFGEGDEFHMAFHFPLMPRMFMGLKLEDRKPITEILEQTPQIPESCQWCLFLRNHDELTLEMVTDVERDYMYDEYARDKHMRINVGIRRRLAPLLDNDRRRIELMNGLLMSLPGTPIIYYGDEIGMGDNVYLGDRNGVRTPMQWNGGWNARIF